MAEKQSLNLNDRLYSRTMMLSQKDYDALKQIAANEKTNFAALVRDCLKKRIEESKINNK